MAGDAAGPGSDPHRARVLLPEAEEVSRRWRITPDVWLP